MWNNGRSAKWSDWAGIPVATTGAGSRTLPHQVDEYVEVAELMVAAEMYGTFKSRI
ncbi:M20 family metallopeptidase [Kyrpidia tusciae]|uniref:M20 family metallopeptidase n=1 Tax=Kyrpidia tusciae TaxID=33943 RepID=UPI0011D0C4EB|nr:M20 family metallopeptidase [Kyrpidia tusciae]